MAEQRQPFRFRLPWLQALPAPVTTGPKQSRPTTAVTQPTPTTAVTQPTPTAPAPRPPFRPAGVAPAQSPPQAQVSIRTESQPPSPSRTATQSRVTSQPSSPSRLATQSQVTSQPSSTSRPAMQTRVTSQPSSPSRPATQSQVTSQPSSPFRPATQTRVLSQPSSPSRAAPQPHTASQSSSPSRTDSQAKPAQLVPQPQSPSRLAPQPDGQTSSSLATTEKQPTAVVTQPLSPPKRPERPQSPTSFMMPPSPVSQQEPKPAAFQLKSQELQSKAEITSGKVLDPPSEAPAQTTFQPSGIAAQPSKLSEPPAAAAPASTADQIAPAPTKNSESSIVSAEPKPFPKAAGKLEETKKMKENVEERREDEKVDGKIYEEQKQRTTELLPSAGSKAAPKEQLNLAFKAEQKQPEQEEILGVKETLPPSGANAKQQKITISHLKDKSTVSESRQKPANGERGILHKEIRDDISKFIRKMATQQPKNLTVDKPVSVITLTGENKGAFMQLGSKSAKREAVHIRRGYRSNPDESAEATTDGEGSSSRTRSKNPRTEEDHATKTYINSNIQSINNSILLSSAVTERNPGVHLVFSQKTEDTKSNNSTEPLETPKAEFSITPAQKLTYEPTVKRRCLRALFMESSDSDPDNPEKPRRHGCRYGCQEKTRDNEIDVL